MRVQVTGCEDCPFFYRDDYTTKCDAPTMPGEERSDLVSCDESTSDCVWCADFEQVQHCDCICHGPPVVCPLRTDLCVVELHKTALLSPDVRPTNGNPPVVRCKVCNVGLYDAEKERGEVCANCRLKFCVCPVPAWTIVNGIDCCARCRKEPAPGKQQPEFCNCPTTIYIPAKGKPVCMNCDKPKRPGGHVVDYFSREAGATIRDCLDCGCLVPGGPSRCKRCANERGKL